MGVYFRKSNRVSLLKSVELLGRVFKSSVELRIELLLAELEQEKARAGKIIWLKTLSAGTLLLSLACLIGLILELTPNQYDYIVFLVAMLLTLSLSLVCLYSSSRLIQRKQAPFYLTRQTLKKDKQRLDSLLGN